MKKQAILLIGRGNIFKDYIQGMINGFLSEYEVLVVDNPSIHYEGKHTRLDIDFNTPIENIDWKLVKDIENELKLNLYESYSNYFYYGRLAQEANIDYSSYWKSKEHIASVFLNSYEFYEDILNKYDLKFAFHDTIDQIWTQILEAFSKKNRFGFYHTLINSGIFDNRIILSYDIPRISPLFYNYLNNFDTNITTKEKLFLEETLDKFTKEKPKLAYMSSRGKKVFDINEIKKIFTNFRNLKYGVKRVFNRIWLENATKDFNLEECGEYILYFMHHQPEATTTSAAQKYVDQWKIIEDIAVNAPSNINIVIKAHPFGYGWQGRDYYEKLLRLPNVFMTPIGYDGKELIKSAKVVLTINGSIGMEAMIYDIPSYTLGKAWYSHIDYIENLDTHLELLNRLDNLKILTQEEKERVLISAYRSSVDFFVSYEDGNVNKKVKAGENLAEHILENKDIYFNRLNLMGV